MIMIKHRCRQFEQYRQTMEKRKKKENDWFDWPGQRWPVQALMQPTSQ